ncbi:enoyl-CoA hydratase/isomerase family protein [Aquihabitans sp. G128]|uniref:enoyl-CoA hydratase/isomerase family protein n=1 Tax=Aquihabitans sp. G128 TaxID=2849779 RepID=UPI0020B447BE|nr:enoyl-CoA hydratase/isomerase family protein [Aquihabitans sp. G128]
MADLDLSSLTTLKAEQRGAVMWIWLDRPEKYHAFDQVLCDELSGLWRHLRTDDSVRAVVLSATGDKAFCTGIDRDFVPAEGGAEYTFSPYAYDDPGQQLGPKANELWKPVVCAVNGMACGGAFYLLGEVDIIISADHATFFDPHVTYGMPAVYEPLLMLHRGMPFGEVLRMTLLGNHERLSAARALEIGLVSEVCTSAELEERAGWIAEAIASAPAGPMQATLRTLWAGRELSRQQALSLGGTFLNLGMSEEALAEGQKTFAGARVKPRIR